MSTFIDLDDNRFFSSYLAFESCLHSLEDALERERSTPAEVELLKEDFVKSGEIFLGYTSWGALFIGQTGETIYPFFRA